MKQEVQVEKECKACGETHDGFYGDVCENCEKNDYEERKYNAMGGMNE